MKMIIESVSQGNSLAAIILITTTIITQVQSRTRFMGKYGPFQEENFWDFQKSATNLGSYPP